MQKIEKIIIKDGKEEKEYSVLVTFDILEKNNSYVLYTDYSKDDVGNLKIYSAIYDKEGRLKPVIEKDEIKIIDDYIRQLEADLKSGIKFS